MKEIEVIELEGIEYMVVRELVIDGVTYIHLAKVDNPEDFCIRKVKTIDEKEMIVGLDNREEFDMVLKIFADKHVEDLEN